MNIDNQVNGPSVSILTGNTQRTFSQKPLGYLQFSGTLCQQSGQWLTELNTVNHVVSVERGQIMPFLSSQPVQWQLLNYAVSNGLSNKLLFPHGDDLPEA